MVYRKKGYKKQYKRVGYNGVSSRRRRVNIPRNPWMQKLRINGLHYFKRTCLLNTSNNYQILAGNFAGVAQGSSINNNSNYNEWYINTGAGNAVNTTNYSMGLNFSLDMLPDYTEFTNLFDQYKILFAKISFRTWATQSSVEASGANNNGQLSAIMHSILDFDDNTAPPVTGAGVFNQLREFASYRTQNFINDGKPLKRVCKPRIAMAAYGGSVFTSYANMKAPWIDANSPDVKHYGMKFGWTVQAPGAAVAYNLFFIPEVTLYLACRNVR